MRVDAILFSCDGRDCGVDVAAVSEVLRIEQMSPVPLAPRVVVGAVCLGSKILPVVDVALIVRAEAQLCVPMASGLHVQAGKHELLLLATEIRGVRSLDLPPSKERDDALDLTREVSTPSGPVTLLSVHKLGEVVERLFDGLTKRRD